MTICIGAICRDERGVLGAAVVVASDRMVTMGGITEFEHEVPKRTDVAPTVACLVSGDSLRGDRIAREIAASCAPNITVPEVANMAASMYARDRLAAAEAAFLAPRGLSLQTFLQGQQAMLPQIVAGLDQQLATFDFNLQLLIAGVDDHGGHVLVVENPGGTTADLAPIGSGAIGSGQIHAIHSLIAFRHSPSRSLEETVFHVYVAKKQAEAAPGVGQDTDMTVLSPNGRRDLDEGVMSELASIYEAFREPAEQRVQQRIGTLSIAPPAAELVDAETHGTSET